MKNRVLLAEGRTLTKETEKKVETKQEPAQPVENVEEQTQPRRALIEIDPTKLKKAEEFGFPLGEIVNGLNAWAGSVESRFESIRTTMPDMVKNSMTEALMEMKTEGNRGKVIPMKQEEAGTESSFWKMAERFIGNENRGGMDEETRSLQKQMYALNLQSIKEDIGFTRAIKNALVSKIAGKAVGEAVKDLDLG